MAMFRTFQTNKKCNGIFILVSIGLLLCYSVYVLQYLIYMKNPLSSILIFISAILFFFLQWSFLKVYLSEPGSVPTFWGIEGTQQNRNQPRKYCLMCHNFKPQRTHHCSSCNKCILNMDHHCPFVNNCIGFYNRKFFMLFLFYMEINLLQVLTVEGYFLTKQLIPIFRQQTRPNIHTAIKIIFYLFQFGIFFPIGTFAAYHLSLVLKNQTTLTQLKRERDIKNGKQISSINIYDIGPKYNFIQVFGKKMWQWFLPISGTLPDDGLNWPKNSYYFQNLSSKRQILNHVSN